MITAELKNYRQSAQKVRLVANTIRGKKVDKALEKLAFTTKRSVEPLVKLLKSAVANAKHNHDLEADNLFIKTITVDEGYTLKRWRPRARGSAFPIRKRTSRVKITLAEKETKVSKAKVAKKEDDKVVAKKASTTKKKTVAKKPAVKKTTTKKENK